MSPRLPHRVLTVIALMAALVSYGYKALTGRRPDDLLIPSEPAAASRGGEGGDVN